MKKTTFLLFLLFSLGTYSQQKTCADYKIGKFTYSDPLFKNWKVIRTATEQIETDDVNKIKLTASIHWVSACEYSLTYTKFNDVEDHPIIGQKLNVKIIKVGNNSVTCKSEGLGTTLELEMVLEQ